MRAAPARVRAAKGRLDEIGSLSTFPAAVFHLRNHWQHRLKNFVHPRAIYAMRWSNGSVGSHTNNRLGARLRVDQAVTSSSDAFPAI